MKIKLFVTLCLCAFLVACPDPVPGAVSNLDIIYGNSVEITLPQNIVISSTEAKEGDEITITGENFLSPENMQWEADNPTVVDYTTHASLEGNMVLFNVSLEEFFLKDKTNRLFHVRGTKVTEFVSFEKNKIVCKVPDGAKSGLVLVIGNKNNLIAGYNPDEIDEGIAETVIKNSVVEFTVLDASGNSIK